jgi:hypothetical protein
VDKERLQIMYATRQSWMPVSVSERRCTKESNERWELIGRQNGRMEKALFKVN